MRLLACLLLLLIPVTAAAVPIVPATIHATFATCFDCFGSPPSYTFDGILSVVTSSGDYSAGYRGIYRGGDGIQEVAAMTGTLNGLPISFDRGEGLSRSWLLDDYFPGRVAFSTSERGYALVWDGTGIPIFAGGTPVRWRAEAITETVSPVTAAPEPATLTLLLTGLVGLLLRARR